MTSLLQDPIHSNDAVTGTGAIVSGRDNAISPAMPLIDPPVKPLTDGVVLLRPFTLDDVASVTNACQDPGIHRWTLTLPWPYREHHARDWIASHEEKRALGTSGQFAVVDAADDRLLGSLGFDQFDWEISKAIVGYWVAAPERNRGVATRALLLGTTWALEELGLSELQLMTLIGNIASERVAQKAAFVMIAEITDHRIATVPDQRFHIKKWKRSARPA